MGHGFVSMFHNEVKSIISKVQIHGEICDMLGSGAYR